MSTSTLPVKTMYSISQDLINVYLELEENGGVLTEEMETALEISETDLQLKAVDYCHLIKEVESQAGAVDTEIKRLTEMKRVKMALVDRLKANVKSAMQHFNMHKIEIGNDKISLRPSQAIEITDVEQLDDSFMVIKKEPSKTAIKAYLDKMELDTVAGAKRVTNYSLQIK